MFQVFCSICCRKPWRNILGVSRSIVWGSWGGRGADNRWSPEVSHLLEFSFMEINKTALNKSRTCKFEKKEKKKKKGETLARVLESEKEKERSLMMSQASRWVQRRKEETGRIEGQKMINVDESGYCVWQKKQKQKKNPRYCTDHRWCIVEWYTQKVIIKDEYIFKKVILRFEQKKYLFWLHLRKFKFGTRSWT